MDNINTDFIKFSYLKNEDEITWIKFINFLYALPEDSELKKPADAFIKNMKSNQIYFNILSTSITMGIIIDMLRSTNYRIINLKFLENILQSLNFVNDNFQLTKDQNNE
jgi:hypothetical protein